MKTQSYVIATIGRDRHYHQVHGGWTRSLSMAKRGPKQKMQEIADDCEGNVRLVTYASELARTQKG